MSFHNLEGEATHNRLLRRVDWRFLLPHPRPHKSVCFADGSLAAAVEHISEHTFRAPFAALGDCDLAVAVNPSSQTLRTAWNALRGGGACYTEWYSPLAGGTRGIRQRMAKAGFDDVRCYWPWPWPGRASAQFWLPMESTGALSYFLQSRPPARTRGGRAARTALHTAWRMLHGAGLIVPICVVARKPAGIDDEHLTSVHLSAQPVADALLDVHSPHVALADMFEQRNNGAEHAPTRSAWLLLTGGRRSVNKVVALVFADGERHPQLVVKMPRVPESVPALEREAAVLHALHAQHPNGVPGVPRTVFFHKQHNAVMLGETALTGVPLYTQLRQDTYRALALKATAWLVRLAANGQPRAQNTWWNRLVAPVLADFSASWDAAIDHDGLQTTRNMLGTLSDLPFVCEQRDFSPWNVLLASDGELVVLDWESAELHGLPVMDLIYFLTYLSFFLDGAMESGRYRESYRATLDPSTFTGVVVNECITQYTEQLGLDPAVVGPLRLLAWMLHARSEYQQFTADVAGKPPLSLLRKSLFVSLWNEELAHGTRT